MDRALADYDGTLLPREARTFVDDIRLTEFGSTEGHVPLVSVSKIIFPGERNSGCVVSPKSVIVGSILETNRKLKSALARMHVDTKIVKVARDLGVDSTASTR